MIYTDEQEKKIESNFGQIVDGEFVLKIGKSNKLNVDLVEGVDNKEEN